MGKRNKFRIIIAVLLVMCIGSACGKPELPEADDTPYSKDTMKLGYDGQDFYMADNNLCNFAETEAGYYYFDESRFIARTDDVKYLMFFDKETRQSIPVCNQPDCRHKSESEGCNARFGIDYGDGDEKPVVSRPRGLWYYEGNLYTVCNVYNSDECIFLLYRISLDGSIRERILDLYTLYSDNVTYAESFFHRGYLYYSITETDGALSLYSIRVEKNAVPVQIFKSDTKTSFISQYRIFDTGILFKEIKFADDGRDLECYLYYYNSVDGSVMKYTDNIDIDSYVVVDNNIYYSSYGKVFRFNPESKLTDEIYDAGENVNLSYDGVYIYAEDTTPYEKPDKHYIYVIDTQGKLIDSIYASSYQKCYFGDSDYLFQMFDLDEDLKRVSKEAVIKAYDKSQIGTGEAEWIELPIFE